MKIFISSLITGFEDFRAAARDAIVQLGHEPVMAEDFSAQPTSPQVACLTGLRQSALVILLMGERYGASQRSGISATHEEYRDAQRTRPVIAFVQEGVMPEPEEQAFITEVQAWESGLFRGGFRTPDQLKGLVTRAVHEWQLANAAGPFDANEILQRALEQIPERGGGHYRGGPTLLVSLAFGPRQNVLRPAEIEDSRLVDDLTQSALFGRNKVFDRGKGTQHRLEGDALLLTQDEEHDSFRIAPTGDMLFRVGLAMTDYSRIVIEEDVQTVIRRTLAFASDVIERIDPTQRLTHLASAVTFADADSLVWRNAAEHAASPRSYPVSGFGRSDHRPVHLTPPVKPRAVLTVDSDHMVEDLVVLLRRKWKDS